MVPGIDDRDRAPLVDGQGPRVAQLPETATGNAPGAERPAVLAELLRSGIAIFTNVKTLVGAEGDVVRERHLTGRRASRPPDLQQATFGAEDLNPMVATVDDVNMVVLVDRQRPRAEKLAGGVAVPAPLPESDPFG